MPVRIWGMVGLGLACALAGAQARTNVASGLSSGSDATATSPGEAGVPAGLAQALLTLGNRAGVIFAGRVTAIARNDDSGYVDVTFRVQQAVRGCASATTYVLREWAGLWTSEDRYEIGQTRLMLLAARGPSGMSAPVGGMAGMIPVMAGRIPPLIRGRTSAPAETAAETVAGPAVDLRWVQALMVPRTAVSGKSWREVSEAESESLPEPLPVIAPAPVKPFPPVIKESLLGPSLSAVLRLLGRTSAP